MAELKTKKTAQSVASFLASIPDPEQRRDGRTLAALMERATGAKGRMWGSIVGFRDVHLRYASGRELDWFALGFAPRKGATTIYLGCGAIDRSATRLLKDLGPHKLGVGCLYLKRLADVDLGVLRRVLDVAAKSNAAQHVEPSIAASRGATATNARSGGRSSSGQRRMSAEPTRSAKSAKPGSKGACRTGTRHMAARRTSS